jgi:hypothetical protein
MTTNKTKTEKDWEKFFDVKSAKKSFVYSSFYLFSYEMLKNTIVDRIKTFYLKGFDENGYIYDDKYKETVLKRKINGKQNIFLAHLYWLKDNNIITDSSIQEIIDIRKHRDLIAHNTDKFLSDSDYEIDFSLLNKTLDYVKNIEKWWITEFEISINPDFDHQEIKTEEITSGKEILINYYKSIVENILNE